MFDNKDIDISENAILNFDQRILEMLLHDHTTGRNILWGTDDYVELGEGYAKCDEITIEKITGENGLVIRPRALKSKERQKNRTREKAEVFTPSWVCNKQNNQIDALWFGRENVFNVENSDLSWTPTTDPIKFPKGKSWQDYVLDNRLEITCGEAPYLASLYDTTTSQPIEIEKRIGILDRKLRVVSEHNKHFKNWIRWARFAFQSTYGFEWQGDNLLIARETMLQTFIDYYMAQFGDDFPLGKGTILGIAEIISWNLWQMDGLTGQRIMTTKQKFSTMIDDINSDFCKIMDWQADEPIYFVSLLNS